MVADMRNREAAPAPSSFEFPPKLLSYQVAALHQQGRREYQEDDLLTVNDSDVTLIRQQGMMTVVADGMGGMAGGREASRTVVTTLGEAFRKMVLPKPAGPQMAAMAHSAGQKVFEALKGRGGSTLAAGFFFDQQFSWVSVGDSYLFLQRGEGIYRINQDMTVRIDRFREALSRNSLDTTEGDNDPERVCITNFVGMRQGDLSPEYSRIPLRLQDQDRILICSDGVAGVLTDLELMHALQIGAPAQACAELDRLVREKNRKNQDNYTALVIQCRY